jgi:hypothetical protein
VAQGTIRAILRFAGLWVVATVTGFLLAALVNDLVVLSPVHSIYQWPAQSQRDLGLLNDLKFSVLVASIMVGAIEGVAIAWVLGGKPKTDPAGPVVTVRA